MRADLLTTNIQRNPITPRVEYSGFDPGSLDFFTSLLSRYKYGKDLNLLLDPSRKFNVVYQAGDNPSIELQNYSQTDVYQGICGEVSNSFGLQALKNPGIRKKYDIVIVTGGAKDMFSCGHAFLLVAPKELNIRQQLGSEENMFPEGALLVDPSLGVIENANVFNTEEGKYKLDGIVPYTDIHNTGNHWRVGLTPNNPNPIIIGFLRDYIPVTDPSNDNRMLYLAFNTNGENKVTSVNFLAHDLSTNNEPQLVNLETLQDNLMEVRNLRKLLKKVSSNLGIGCI